MQSKIVIAAVSGLGIGALLGWAITADIYENRTFDERKQYDQMLRNKTQHIWALQDRFERMTAVADGSELRIRIDDEPEIPILGQQSFEDLDFGKSDDESVVPDGETPEETRSNLQKLIDMYTASSDLQVEEEFIVSGAEYDTQTPPFVISKAKYAWDDEGDSYEKITLTYYPRDRVLLDDDDEPIEDVARLVGWRNLTQFGVESEDPDVVFIRNRKLETDFEVIKEEEARLPLHVKYGMEKEEFRVNRAAGLIKLRQEDE